MDHQLFSAWLEDFVDRSERLRRQGEQLRAAARQTVQAVRRTRRAIRDERLVRRRAVSLLRAGADPAAAPDDPDESQVA